METTVMKLTRIALVITIALVAAGPASGQERKPVRVQEQNQYLVSVKAGMVNMAEGDVTYRRGDDGWEMLLAGDSLRGGDLVRTGANSRVEVLLNPGSYLRLAENAEFVLSNAAIDNLKLEILKGSAIIEAASIDGWKGTIATVSTPSSAFGIVKGGLYRINVLADKTEVLVRKGRIVYPDESRPAKDAEWLVSPGGDGKKMVAGVAVKEGKRIAFEGAAPAVAALGREVPDELDVWSKDRGRTLVAANKKISDRALRRVSTFASAWFYNPLLGCYTFLPGYYGFSSPYGGSYSVCNFYGNSYYPRRPRNPNLGGGYTGGGSGSGQGSGGYTGGGSGGGAVSRPGGSGGMGAGRGGDGGAMPSNPRTGPSGVGGRNRDH
jgi:hypothetical protein